MAKASIEIDERIVEALRIQAEAHHLPLTTFLKHIAENGMPVPPTLPATEEEWNRMFDDASSESPGSQSTFPRAEIYIDHD